jgi:NAD(P)H-dependent nitrite reductase small subunit
MSGDGWVRVCRADEIRPDEGKGVVVNGIQLGLYRLQDGCFALGDVCSHAYALLSTGFVEDDAVECPLHQARFEIRTGRSLDDIAPEDVKAYPVKVEAGEVYVRL